MTASAAGKSGIGTAAEAQASPFVAIADALPFYKAEFVTQCYSGQETLRTNCDVSSGSRARMLELFIVRRR